MQDLHWDCCVSMDDARVVAKMPRLRKLRLDIFDAYGPHSAPACDCPTDSRRSCSCHQETLFNESYASFFLACHQLFPLDPGDHAQNDHRDNLLTFPSMADFQVTAFLEGGAESTADTPLGFSARDRHPEKSCFGIHSIDYHLRRTCFGHVKRFLGFSTVLPGPKCYAALSPEDISRDAPPSLERIMGDQFSELKESC